MELCFVPSGNYVQFIHAYASEQNISRSATAGEIVTEDGEILARHDGVHQFTIGQRKGLGFSTGKALYVLSIDAQTNRVVVGEDQALHKTTCEIANVNWVSCEMPTTPLRAKVKIRHKHESSSATVEALDATTARAVFDTPQRAITAGQAAVLYDGDRVLAGGWIR
jgi:tRNA-specific 2-thiouridylase